MSKKFDVVIGNPPYQEDDNESNKGSAIPIYNYFMESTISMRPQLISLITPSIWFTGGKGLGKFRDDMLSDSGFKYFHHFETPRDVFTNVSLRGGVNFFIWDSEFNNNDSDIVVKTQKNRNIVSSIRPYTISGIDFFMVSSVGISIIRKISNLENISYGVGDSSNLSGHISARNPFGFTTNFKNDDLFKTSDVGLTSPIKIYASRGDVGFVERSLINKNEHWIDHAKLITPFANNIGTDLNDDNLNTIVTEQNAIVTETYLIVGIDLLNSIVEINSMKVYLETKFVRYMISLAKANQNGTRKTYRLVPLQNFTEDSDIDWSVSISEIDQQLYRKYGLNEEEINFIESNIKEMT